MLRTLILNAVVTAITVSLLYCSYQAFQTHRAFWSWAPVIEQRLNALESATRDKD